MNQEELLRQLPDEIQRRFLLVANAHGRRITRSTLQSPVSDEEVDFWLQRARFDEFTIKGDGHCFYRCALYGDGSGTGDFEVMQLRNELVDFVIAHADDYQNFIDTSRISFEDYMKKMRNSNEWADHFVIQAYADMTMRRVIIFDESVGEVRIISPTGGDGEIRGHLNVAFNGVHYDFLFEVEGGEDASEVMGEVVSEDDNDHDEEKAEEVEDEEVEDEEVEDEGVEEKNEVEGNDGFYEGEGDEEDSGEEDSGEEDSTSDESDNNNGYEVRYKLTIL